MRIQPPPESCTGCRGNRLVALLWNYSRCGAGCGARSIARPATSSARRRTFPGRCERDLRLSTITMSPPGAAVRAMHLYGLNYE